MLDILIMIGGIGGASAFVHGLYCLITGQMPHGTELTAGQLAISGAVGLVVGYQAYKFKMRRKSWRISDDAREKLREQGFYVADRLDGRDGYIVLEEPRESVEWMNHLEQMRKENAAARARLTPEQAKAQDAWVGDIVEKALRAHRTGT